MIYLMIILILIGITKRRTFWPHNLFVSRNTSRKRPSLRKKIQASLKRNRWGFIDLITISRCPSITRCALILMMLGNLRMISCRPLICKGRFSSAIISETIRRDMAPRRHRDLKKLMERSTFWFQICAAYLKFRFRAKVILIWYEIGQEIKSMSSKRSGTMAESYLKDILCNLVTQMSRTVNTLSSIISSIPKIKSN